MDKSFVEVIGIELDVVGAGRVTAHLTVTEQHLQPFGIVHGGVYAAIAETVASVGAYHSAQALDPGTNVVGLENHTSFLRTARAGATVLAESVPIHAGRRVQLWDVNMVDEANGRSLATSRIRLLVVDPATLP